MIAETDRKQLLEYDNPETMPHIFLLIQSLEFLDVGWLKFLIYE